MRSLTEKYLEKLKKSRLADEAVYIIDGMISKGSIEPDKALFGTAMILKTPLLFFAKPLEPFFTALNKAAYDGDFAPNDSETRTFLHSIPVIDSMSTHEIVNGLKQRKAVFIKDIGVVTSAPYGAEQAYIYFCSVCFAGFVKFFTDAGENAIMNRPYDRKLICEMLETYKRNQPEPIAPKLMTDIFTSPDSVKTAMAEAGKATVDLGLVDSFFGNISCLYDGNIYISRTGSSLDELINETDVCPVDESGCQGITASSELASHKKIYELADSRLILHGHPRFSVIMSMLCSEKCDNRGKCHYACDRKRTLNGVPIVSGEVGNGPRAMVNTMPAAVKEHKDAIVYGHGVFTVSAEDFNEAFARLVRIETEAFQLYHHLTCQPDAD